MPKKPWYLAIPYDEGAAYPTLFPDYLAEKGNRLGPVRRATRDQFRQILIITKEGEKYRAFDLSHVERRSGAYLSAISAINRLRGVHLGIYVDDRAGVPISTAITGPRIDGWVYTHRKSEVPNGNSETKLNNGG